MKTTLGDSGLGRAPVIEVETKKITSSFRNDFETPLKHRSHCRQPTDSDHIPVMCKFQIKLKKLRKAKANPKFEMDFLKSDEKLRAKISKAVHNKYETLNNISEVEESVSEMKNSLNEVIEKNVPKKKD
ncbi:hypothetical protein PoB_007123600 [Plakobranchus ocellatus]|uniref:Uncharacterized protein n=1 Tax=Plakobranchus ocellatus TaxID=259542 RepID=A0AAV4DLH9_9GAST|nr:hypothetical protein PoB_007123600 [Plakobranchus ocellatus]